MRARPGRRQSGFTLVEMIITSVVFTVIVAATLQATLSAEAGFGAAVTRNDLDVRAHRALDVILDQFQTAGVSGLTPSCAAPLGSDHLTYRTPEAIVAGAVTWEAASSIVFEHGADEPDNGLDDDGDGVIDEGRIVLVRNVGQANQTRTILATDVPELMPGEVANGLDDNGDGLTDEHGLSFALTGGLLTVRLAVTGTDAERRPVSSVQSVSIQLRN